MYNEKKIERFERWTRLLNRATIFCLIATALYIDFAFNPLLAGWFRLSLGLLILIYTVTQILPLLKTGKCKAELGLKEIQNSQISLDNR